jgi:DNA-3-methyladenine glycosylase I
MSAAYCRLAPSHEFHGPYHGQEYGFPSRDDAVLFERLALEINQAGLSWLTVLKKRAAFQRAFRGFDIDTVAAFGPEDVQRLLNDPGIIRNRLKVAAVIGNAKRLQEIRARHGSFAAWLDAHHPRSKSAWVDLFKETFRFTGGEIVNEFLMSLGYLPGAHAPSCPVFSIIGANVPWRKAKATGAKRKNPRAKRQRAKKSGAKNPHKKNKARPVRALPSGF